MIDQQYHNHLDLIHYAIVNQRVIQFKVNSTWRTVEPYITGLQGGSQSPGLYGFCRDTTVNRWQVFRLEEMQGLELTYYRFDPHPDYQEQSLLFTQIYRRVVLDQPVVPFPS